MHNNLQTRLVTLTLARVREGYSATKGEGAATANTWDEVKQNLVNAATFKLDL